MSEQHPQGHERDVHHGTVFIPATRLPVTYAPAPRRDVPKSLYILLGILTTFVVGLAVVVALLLIPQQAPWRSTSVTTPTSSP
ncbi:hypothetical protein [Acrocarpospora sp. B8E8]|uniref:hypothetical protein n=1 Tax=Acrocarpospora sp. B8E8 TaxID=3153572 RepID=UPI00325D843C